jgi:hypothetical protein
MISFWTLQDNHGIHAYRSNRGLAIADRFTPRAYEQVGASTELAAGTQLFSALDQLSPVQQRLVAHLWDEHARAAPQARRLNDPRRALLRFDLLRRLRSTGLSSFGVYRAEEIDAIERFPVFVREIHRHNGPKSKLLHNHQQVRQAIQALRIRGRRRENLMIVEFADASGADGLFRKYAAFRVGDRIIACHVMASSHWCVKSQQNQLTEEALTQDLAYVRDNPHLDWLQRVFEAGGIDYGRIDYGVAGGQPQAWEINLNPTIGREPGQSKKRNISVEMKQMRESTRELFHDQLRAAFLALDDPSARTFSVRLAPALLAELDADAAQRRRQHRLLRLAKAVYNSPTWGRPVRLAYSLFPRR